MREKYSGKSRGFGFVTFAAPADAHRAVGAEHEIDGRKCEAKFALPEGKVGSARTTRIFVARIPASVTDQQFRAYFEQVGMWLQARLCVCAGWLAGGWLVGLVLGGGRPGGQGMGPAFGEGARGRGCVAGISVLEVLLRGAVEGREGMGGSAGPG